MINHEINEKGIVFSCTFNGRKLDFNEWIKTNDIIYYSPLSTLADNGFAEISGQDCIVPFESVYLLDDMEKIVLGLPSAYDKEMRLEASSMLNSDDLQYRLQLLTSVPDGDLLPFQRKGNIVTIEDKNFLLSEEQYKLFNLVDEFNALRKEEKTYQNNLKTFSNIKELTQKAECELDSYLANESVFAPEKIKLEINKTDDGFSVKPAVDMPDKEKFTQSFERHKKVKDVYPIQNENGERTRVALTPEQVEGLKVLKSNNGTFSNGSQLMQTPTEFFDPEQFDLSEFYSDRVIEIGAYKPKFFPFICPYKSQWVFGARVESRSSGTTEIKIKDEDELKELNDCIETARKEGKDIISYKGADIDINDAVFLAEKAEQQINNPAKPIFVDKPDERKVLIIKDNTELLEYEAEDRDIEETSRYTFYANDCLNDGISLKKHQEEGVAWLQYLFSQHADGCLLADDMGLGKTLQVLYFIDWHSRKHPNHKPYLIVAPVSLLENWLNEYKKFFSEPRMDMRILSSKDVPRKFDKDVVDRMSKREIILTNYETLRNAQLNFCAVEFDIVALDEAQRIKTPGTLVTNAAKALKCNFKIALTGTPVENTLVDLWCIMDFCVPGLLGNAKSFAAKYQNPLKNKDCDVVALGNEVRNELGVYLMRRLKKDAQKDLPAKREIRKRMEMTKLQNNLYCRIIDDYNKGLNGNMLIIIQSIKEISEHPYLYDETASNHQPEELVAESARMMLTVGFIDQIKQRKEKVIVFAERKESQKMLQRVFYNRYGILAAIINGDTPTRVTAGRHNKLSRQSCIDRFQSGDGFGVIIMSPIAAGTGLNVTAANNVIHYSRHWNPAKENQATDRAYRIGQTKDVSVYYPMADSKDFKSFDIVLDELLATKSKLASSAMFPTERIEVRPEDFSQMLNRGTKITPT